MNIHKGNIAPKCPLGTPENAREANLHAHGAPFCLTRINIALENEWIFHNAILPPFARAPVQNRSCVYHVLQFLLLQVP